MPDSIRHPVYYWFPAFAWDDAWIPASAGMTTLGRDLIFVVMTT